MAGATLALPEETVEGDRAPAGPWRVALRRLLRKKLAVAALLFIAFFYVVGLFAPVLAPRDFREQDLENDLQGPSLEHPFGTDRLGRDQLSRVIWSARTTMIVTVATVVTGSLVLAVGLGMLSGYVGGKVDTAIMRSGEVFASLPGLLMLILINATTASMMRKTNSGPLWRSKPAWSASVEMWLSSQSTASSTFERIVELIRMSMGSAGNEAKTSPVRMIAVSTLPPR